MNLFTSIFVLLSLTANAQQQSMLENSLDSIFNSYFKAGEPGGAVLLVKNGKILYKKGFGIADTKTKETITSKTLFNLGSISKTVVAYGILKLAEEGKLSLDDNLYKYFPEFKNKSIAEKVKIVHLLTHSSGLPDSRNVSKDLVFWLTAKDQESWAPLLQTEQFEFEPGTKYKYSNPAFNGLALIIEKVSGQKWQDYISKVIFKPAGMMTSTITDGPHPEDGVSHAYVLNDKKEFEELDYGEEATFAASGNGGVWSNVEELWSYEQAIQKAQFLTADWIRKSRTVFPLSTWKDQQPSRLGLSWFLTTQSNQDMIGHTGSQGGFISDYCWFPDQKVFYVLLCNIPRPIEEIRTKVVALVLK
jgi:CubicO group peptidase (beta-lactamase class C family)